jgi:8-oxo-dGTP pyrophosphatase MutT (NUDIX family)
MKPETWSAHVTVAAIVEREGRFLLVEEHTADGLRLNQPAGHLESGETLVEAVMREALEETAQPFTPEALVGVYMTHFDRSEPPVGEAQSASGTATHPVGAAQHSGAVEAATAGGGGVTYVRFTYCGTSNDPVAGRALDPDIVRTVWMSADELRACPERHRTPLVMRCIDDYLAGRRFPLDFVHTHSVGPVRSRESGEQ